MTNYIILQHSDGVNESNLFYGYDWFENTVPYAYSANERADIYSSTASSGIQIDAPDFNDTYPRLFESEFGTVDGTPVTNIQVGYLQAGGPNWTTYVIAVSGTTGFVPVQIGAYRAAQNVYPGNAAVFSVTPSLGTLPSYQWQYVNNSGATNNVVNGPTGTGSTISGANSPLSPLTLLVSTSSVITTPGDPIADFYNAIGTADPFPATGLGASNIIDGTLTPYLNYGGAARGNSFTGPVGFVVTPSIGNTVVTAARIYASTNSTADDPADITLYGSTNGLTWSFIAYSSLSLPSPRNLSAGAINSNNEVLQEIDFPDNTTNYYEYAVYFTNAAGGNTATVGIEFAEVQLLGNVILQEPYMVTQPQSASLYVGDNLKLSGVEAGTAPLNYQWQFNGAAISGATNSGITFIPTASANAGSYALIVTNLY